MAISQEWWDEWWGQDYSWDGLAKKRWKGWVVPTDGVPVPAKKGVEGRDATLQDYWRRAGLDADIERPEFQCPQTGRRFTRVHLPLHFLDGSETLKGVEDPAFLKSLDEILRAELARPIVETEFQPWGELIGADHRLQWSGAVLDGFDLGELSGQTRSDDDRIPISLHASNAAFSGYATFKSAAFSGDAFFKNAAFSGHAIFESVAFSGYAFFESAAFSGDTFFNDAAFSGHAAFWSAAFSGHAIFESAAFSGHAIFESAAFSGYAFFKNAAFSGDTFFNDAAFSGGANFENAAFSGDTFFKDAAFAANFENAAFSGHANFESAANFENAAFSGNAYFQSAAFSGEAIFESAAFSGYAFFKNAAFSGHAIFESVAFSGYAFFESAAFSGHAYFQSAAFSGHAYFQSAAFSGHAYFQSAAFSENANFESAAFSGEAIFESAAFSGDADFHSAAFFGAAQFSGEGRSLKSEPVDQAISLKSQSVAEGMELTGQLTGAPSPLSITRRSVKRFVAKEAVFLGPVDLSNRDILNGSETDESDFHRAHFFHLFKLHGSALHRGINFGKTDVDQARERGKTRDACLPMPDALIKGLANLKRAMPERPVPPRKYAEDWEKTDSALRSAIYSGDLDAFQSWRKDQARAFAEGPVEDRIEYFRALEDCYRTLKLFNEDRRDRPEEGRFHRLELIARRRRRPNYPIRELFSLKREKVGIPMWERMMSHIYGWGSNYGNSVVLPIGWLLGGVFVFAGLYLLMSDWFVHTPNSVRFGEALNFSFGRVFPFGPWDAPEACSAIGQMLDPLTDVGKEACKAQLGDAFEARAYKGGTPLTLRLLASFQSLSAIILVFLSGLAIRRRFQIN